MLWLVPCTPLWIKQKVSQWVFDTVGRAREFLLPPLRTLRSEVISAIESATLFPVIDQRVTGDSSGTFHGCLCGFGSVVPGRRFFPLFLFQYSSRDSLCLSVQEERFKDKLLMLLGECCGFSAFPASLLEGAS